MAIRYNITHTTVYRYRAPVRFGEHRVMFRPRDSHDLRVLATDLDVSPDASVRMIQDPHSNSVALVQPLTRADELRIVCTFTIEHAHAGVRAHVEVGRQHAQVVAVARPEHHAVLAEAHRCAVAVDRGVGDVVADRHLLPRAARALPARAAAAGQPLQTPSRSTSNISVAFGGITPPAPRAP